MKRNPSFFFFYSISRLSTAHQNKKQFKITLQPRYGLRIKIITPTHTSTVPRDSGALFYKPLSRVTSFKGVAQKLRAELALLLSQKETDACGAWKSIKSFFFLCDFQKHFTKTKKRYIHLQCL